MWSKTTQLLATASVLVAFSGCGREEDPELAQEPLEPSGTPEVSAVTAEAWVDDLKLGTASSRSEMLTSVKESFAQGEPVHLSLEVDDAPNGATVTTYWYGPENLPLAYETQTIDMDQERLRFVLANTTDLRAGDYRVVVRVGDEVVDEKSFQIQATG